MYGDIFILNRGSCYGVRLVGCNLKPVRLGCSGTTYFVLDSSKYPKEAKLLGGNNILILVGERAVIVHGNYGYVIPAYRGSYKVIKINGCYYADVKGFGVVRIPNSLALGLRKFYKGRKMKYLDIYVGKGEPYVIGHGALV